MTPQTKPSAGALRTAMAIMRAMNNGSLLSYEMAEIIDQESGLAELARAAEAMLGVNNPPAGHPGHIDFAQAADMLQEALNKVRNPNATVRQVAPAGRWTEKKGTV